MKRQATDITVKLIPNGVQIQIDKQKHSLTYPSQIWDKFPASLRRVFSHSLAYASTWHLPLVNHKIIKYHFPIPLIEQIFFKILLYSVPINIFIFKGQKTSKLIKKFYNANFLTQYEAGNAFYPQLANNHKLQNKALLLFSFGKDSMLTYALLKELGINQIPIYIQEPQSDFENNHKHKLALSFLKKLRIKILFFPLTLGSIRQNDHLYWGWDVILSQYTLLLVPYFYFYQTKYLFFGNEQSCNFYTKEKEGYLVNPVYEQSSSAMQLLQNIPKLFSINTHIGSLVEPLHEIFVTYILHHRYPKLAQFQMSCFSEEPQAKKNRWCCHCDKCARIFIFLKALNIDPKIVGFKDEIMLTNKKAQFYSLFSKNFNNGLYSGSGLADDEQLLAFFLAYKNGTRGELIEKFKTKHLKKVKAKAKRLINEYFGIHSSLTIPLTLTKPLMKIFTQEQKTVFQYCQSLLRL